MSDETIAIIPVRSLSGGKTRLAAVLSPRERHDLIASMLRQATRAALEAGPINRAIVVSGDAETLDFATSLDPRVIAVRQGQREGLLAALDVARTTALASNPSSLAILFGDLPLIEPVDVRVLLAHDTEVVIAPDRRGAGTNALVLRGRAIAPFAFQFGTDSRQRHENEAARLSLTVSLCRAPGTLFDLDTPDDWRVLSIPSERLAVGDVAGGLLQEATPR